MGFSRRGVGGRRNHDAPYGSALPLMQQAARLTSYRGSTGRFGWLRSLMTSRSGRPLCRGVDRGLLDLTAYEGLEFGEVRRETPGQLARGLVIGLLVGPGAARVEHLARDLGAALGHHKPEIGVLAHRCGGEPAVECRAQQRARVMDRHAPADAVGAAGPARIDEPALRPVLFDARTQHLGVDRRMARHERRAETVEKVASGALLSPFSVPATRAV